MLHLGCRKAALYRRFVSFFLSRFPGVGIANAKSRLRLLSLCLNDNHQVCSLVISDLAQLFDVLFPNMEYLVGVSWIPEGK